MVVAHLGKYRSLIPSLALLIHLADVGTGPVGKDSLLRACEWGEYLESHAGRIYAPALSPDIVAARALGDHIQRGDLGRSFAARDVYRKGWSGLTDQETLLSALSVLEDLDWVVSVKERTGGRTKTRWDLNPHLLEE
jgi:putative DNA primase/helicase